MILGQQELRARSVTAARFLLLLCSSLIQQPAADRVELQPVRIHPKLSGYSADRGRSVAATSRATCRHTSQIHPQSSPSTEKRTDNRGTKSRTYLAPSAGCSSRPAQPSTQGSSCLGMCSVSAVCCVSSGKD